jgi:hypothetical protein
LNACTLVFIACFFYKAIKFNGLKKLLNGRTAYYMLILH